MKNNPIILGLNFGGHDTSACLTINGKLIAACEEERYNKEKHTREFPTSAISNCLDKAKISINSVDEIALTFDPIYSIRENYLKAALNDDKRIQFLINDIDRIEQVFNIKELVKQKTGFQGNVECHRHHLCHLASSYYLSGFKSALLISHDGMGEIDCSSMGEGIDGEITSLHKGNRYPHSLGLFYSAITHYLGWKHHSDEGIIMGLAPFGDDNQIVSSCGKTYKELFKEIIYEA